MIEVVVFSPENLAPPYPRAILVEWIAGEGERVAAGDTLCRYEVDKAVGTISSPRDGWMRRRLASEGDRILPRAPLAALSDEPDEALSTELLFHSPAGIDPDVFDWSEVDNAGGSPVPLDPMRRVIADRMAMSKRHIPCFYLTATVDMSGAVALRNAMRGTGAKATFNDMAIRAAALTLCKYPKVAGIYTPDGIVPRTEINIGFAAALPDDGLVVPVVKAADRKSLAEVAAETRRLSAKAKSGELAPDDCRGGVFSVSYLGAMEVDNFVAIVNPGEAAIMAVGKTCDTPMAVDGAVQIRPIAKMTISCDHRSIDGALAARFMTEVKRLMEKPTEL